ncbi:MAG: SulP family inorganic anion transporter [Ferruginibacter sp.]
MKKIFQNAGADVPASIVVFLVAIPLCLGIAVASGLNEFSGIIGGIVGGVVVGFLSGSQLSVSGPAAGLTAIVAAAVLKLPAPEAFFLAVVIAGIFQLFMGFFKLGVIGDYVPNSVIKGMLAAIGIILILKQLPHLVGYDKDFEGDEAFIQASGENTFSSIFYSLNNLTPNAMIIGITGLLILIVYEIKWVKSKKIFQLISGPLVVVIVGILLNKLLGGLETTITQKDAHLVNIPIANSTSEFLSFFRLPDWSFIANTDVWITAITLALVASLETLLGIEAVDKLDPLKRVSPPNRELMAQGAGNMVSGLLGGLPLTSVIVRSSANVNAGARTKVSAILHGLLILVCVAFVPNILNLIPKAALGRNPCIYRIQAGESIAVQRIFCQRLGSVYAIYYYNRRHCINRSAQRGNHWYRCWIVLCDPQQFPHGSIFCTGWRLSPGTTQERCFIFHQTIAERNPGKNSCQQQPGIGSYQGRIH